MKIVGILGQSGSGKDSMADVMRGYAKVGLADPLKRYCREVFDFSIHQLWGPSAERNKPDQRYFRGWRGVCTKCINTFYTWNYEEKTGGVFDEQCFYCGTKLERFGPQTDAHGHNVEVYLTPRYALQTLGTEWGRNCYTNTWVDYAIRVASRLEAGWEYSAPMGVCGQQLHKYTGIAIPDVRFKNEVAAIKKAGGVVIRVDRPGYGGNMVGGIQNHASEKDQKEIPDSEFLEIIKNDKGLAEFCDEISRVMKTHNLET
jgi:hypothetical protein